MDGRSAPRQGWSQSKIDAGHPSSSAIRVSCVCAIISCIDPTRSQYVIQRWHERSPIARARGKTIPMRSIPSCCVLSRVMIWDPSDYWNSSTAYILMLSIQNWRYLSRTVIFKMSNKSSEYNFNSKIFWSESMCQVSNNDKRTSDYPSRYGVHHLLNLFRPNVCGHEQCGSRMDRLEFN